MAVKIERNSNNGILMVEVSDNFNPEELITALTPFYEKFPRGAHLFFIIDFLSLNEDPEGETLMNALFSVGKTSPHIPAHGGFLANSDLGYGEGKVIQPIYSGVGLRARVFKSEEEASKWLLSGLE
jgi:hypothetical protein